MKVVLYVIYVMCIFQFSKAALCEPDAVQVSVSRMWVGVRMGPARPAWAQPRLVLSRVTRAAPWPVPKPGTLSLIHI